MTWDTVSSVLGSAIDSGEVLGELAARTLEECDYTREAANQQLFRRLWASQPDVRIPDIVAFHCTRRVLTSELVSGAPLDAFAARAPQSVRDAAPTPATTSSPMIT
jgi:predicted unusual protein kinase regulating ubiquinone biosynthesis (AarF/ABC1/UbiB family)